MTTSTQVKLTIGAVILAVFLFISLFFIWPQYRVWQQGQKGKANLAQAEQERQILVMQARAEKEAASIRAEAITILGGAAKKYPEYREQEFMAAFAEALMSDKIEQMIYVPTEAQIPIMEANRLVMQTD